MQIILLFLSERISLKLLIRIQHITKTVVHFHFKTSEMENGIIMLALLTSIHYPELKRGTISPKAQDYLVPKKQVR